MSADLTTFWEKVREVGDTLLATGDYKSVAPTLREIVAIVQQHPDAVNEFETAFIEIMENPTKYSGLVVTYCMHTLRFPKVRQHAEERMRRSPLRTDAHARHVLEAYSSDWPVKSLFESESP